jgi:hypothetical protein
MKLAAYSDLVSVYAALGRDGLPGGPRGYGGYLGLRLNVVVDQK